MIGSLFPLGQTVATPGALETMTRYGISPAALIARHVTGDWGTLDSEDKAANNHALGEGGRILSSYGEGDGNLWVITEADRSSTCILRPDEY